MGQSDYMIMSSQQLREDMFQHINYLFPSSCSIHTQLLGDGEKGREMYMRNDNIRINFLEKYTAKNAKKQIFQ